MELLHKELTYKIRKCLFEVYNTLGPGFDESVYLRSLIIEFKHHGIAYETEKPIKVRYKSTLVKNYKLDLVVENKIILEIKAVTKLNPAFKSQIISYLKAAQLDLGLLVNFGKERLEIERIILSNKIKYNR